jgi:hypothetical protein
MPTDPRALGAPGSILAHVILALGIGLLWAALCWSAQRYTADSFHHSVWVWVVPSAPLLLGIAFLATRHRRAWLAVGGACIAAVVLNGTMTVATRLLGPVEDIGTGALLSFALLFLGLPQFVLGAHYGSIAARRASRAERRRLAGCCPACAYALVGLNASKCPECGRAV